MLRRKCDPDQFAIRQYVRRHDRWMGCEWLVWEGLGGLGMGCEWLAGLVSIGFAYTWTGGVGRSGAGL